jgi:hypothetical protein
MSLDLFVPVTLDKPRKLKLTIDDMIEVYDALNASPTRKTEINGLTIHGALGAFDWRAWDTVLWAGLRHSDRAIESPEDAHVLLRRYVERGGDLSPVAKAIRLAMMRSGALPRKVWERIDGRTRPDEAENGAEYDAEGTPAGPRAAPESSM